MACSVCAGDGIGKCPDCGPGQDPSRDEAGRFLARPRVVPATVIIDGVRYVPASDAGLPVREVVARALAEMFWGGLDDVNWEEEFREKMSGVSVRVTEDPHAMDSLAFLDRVTAIAAGARK